MPGNEAHAVPIPNESYSPEELNKFQRIDYLIFNEGLRFLGCMFDGKSFVTKVKNPETGEEKEETTPRPYWLSIDANNQEIKPSPARLCS